MRKWIAALAVCGALACLLAGCGNSAVDTASKTVSGAASKAEEELRSGVSRMESGWAYSGSSRADRASSNPGAVDSGTDGFLGSEDRENRKPEDRAPGTNSAMERAEAAEYSAAMGMTPSPYTPPEEE